MVNHIVDLGLLKELDNKKSFLNSVGNRRQVKEYLEDEANQHSSRIEKPKALIYDRNVNEKDKELRLRDIKYYQDSLKWAWEYAIHNINHPLNEDFIKFVAGKIDPSYFQEYSDEILSTGKAPYRRINDAVRPTGATVTPPYPAKVPREMERLVENINKLSNLVKIGEVHPVELAAYTHLHFVKIHPFPDANGRTSRLLQNTILNKKGFPPGIIYEGERRTYHQLLDNAIVNYNMDNGLFDISNQEKQFFTFIADKVNISLDKILDSNQ